jgi:hypothetical protein
MKELRVAVNLQVGPKNRNIPSSDPARQPENRVRTKNDMPGLLRKARELASRDFEEIPVMQVAVTGSRGTSLTKDTLCPSVI